MNNVSDLFKNNLGTFEVDLDTTHHFSGMLYAKQMKIPKGYCALSHKHEYDHLSILAEGQVVVQTDNDIGVLYKAPACINIKKGINHSITATEDAVWFCVHSTEETNSSNVDEVLIMKEGI